jgi:hypothetical protein
LKPTATLLTATSEALHYALLLQLTAEEETASSTFSDRSPGH